MQQIAQRARHRRTDACNVATFDIVDQLYSCGSTDDADTSLADAALSGHTRSDRCTCCDNCVDCDVAQQRSFRGCWSTNDCFRRVLNVAVSSSSTDSRRRRRRRNCFDIGCDFYDVSLARSSHDGCSRRPNSCDFNVDA